MKINRLQREFEIRHSKMLFTMSVDFIVVGILLFMYMIFRAIEHAFSRNYLDGMFSFALEFLVYFCLRSGFIMEKR